MTETKLIYVKAIKTILFFLVEDEIVKPMDDETETIQENEE